jgi:SAM-dependent methyltransferase
MSEWRWPVWSRDGSRSPGSPLDGSSPISFATSTGPTAAAYEFDFRATLDDLLASLPDGATVAELGAGANPSLSDHPRVVARTVDLLAVDISQEQLDRAEDLGHKVQGDVAAASFSLGCQVDLACSQMLAEHVVDGEQLLRNVAAMLAPGGVYLQVSPVLYTFPFTVNRLAPEALGEKVLDIVHPRDQHRRGKFPARYDRCRGPGAAQLRLIDRCGLRVIAARGYFGHSYYERLPGLRGLEAQKSELLARHPVPGLCSFALYLMTTR